MQIDSNFALDIEQEKSISLYKLSNSIVAVVDDDNCLFAFSHE